MSEERVSLPLPPAAQVIQAKALTYPEAHEDMPWGEHALKVRGKVFMFMYCSRESLSMSMKLPSSHKDALEHDFAKPTGYGLGKSGWVTMKFDPDGPLPTATLLAWLDESYRAVAPKGAIAALDGVAVKKPVAKRAAKKRLRASFAGFDALYGGRTLSSFVRDSGRVASGSDSP